MNLKEKASFRESSECTAALANEQQTGQAQGSGVSRDCQQQVVSPATVAGRRPVSALPHPARVHSFPVVGMPGIGDWQPAKGESFSKAHLQPEQLSYLARSQGSPATLILDIAAEQTKQEVIPLGAVGVH